ncbi:MAG: PorT family protein [Tannerellaceae bacterium]|jgi:opacity protein-like surface antigen|nr:PorT family protein [Tannerellaceae bacterium]
MKKEVLFILLTMMSVGTLKAQWSVTPEAGMTAFKRAGSQLIQPNWRSGWKLGAGVEYDLNERFSLKSGLYYTQRGYSLSYLSGGPYSSPSYTADYYYGGDYYQGGSRYMSVKINRQFLQLPVMAKFAWDIKKDVRVNVAAGPYIALSIRDDWEWISYSEIDHDGRGGGYLGEYQSGSGYGSSAVRPFDWGLSGSVGIEVNNWVANMGYDLSLAKEGSWDDVRANYHTLSLSVGYKFNLGK